jgi:hypothetical protein
VRARSPTTAAPRGTTAPRERLQVHEQAHDGLSPAALVAWLEVGAVFIAGAISDVERAGKEPKELVPAHALTGAPIRLRRMRPWPLHDDRSQGPHQDAGGERVDENAHTHHRQFTSHSSWGPAPTICGCGAPIVFLAGRAHDVEPSECRPPLHTRRTPQVDYMECRGCAPPIFAVGARAFDDTLLRIP